MVDEAAIKRQVEKILQGVLQQTAGLAQEMINNYLMDLEAHIGKIPGTGSSDLNWQPLAPSDEVNDTFWYKTGAVAEHIISVITIEKNRIHVVAGLPRDAPGYQEALWNEFGWTPHGTSKVVRRALFMPLAEYHIRELNAKLKSKFSKMRLNIRINI